MVFENKPLDAIEEADLQELVTREIPERKAIEYKRDLIGNADADKKEFLADATSFANASGGHMIIGMAEDNGVPTDLCGIDLSDPDGKILQLENIVRDGITPRMPIEMRAVKLPSIEKYALVIRIPQSWQSPHMVSFRGTSRFYSRNSAGKYQLDVSEIRAAFILSETATERIRDFRADRLSKVIAGETPVEVMSGAQAVLHLVPLNAFRPGTSLDLETLLRNKASKWRECLYLRPFTYLRRNFDGILCCNALEANVVEWYLQLFRNGCAEFVQYVGVITGHPIIPHREFEESFIDIFGRILSLQQFLGVEPPVIVMLSLMGVRGFTLELNIPLWKAGSIRQPIDKDQLIIPERILEVLECDAAPTLKPLFDVVWNASGEAGSVNFNEDGNWAPK
jgi:hypothetical protein